MNFINAFNVFIFEFLLYFIFKVILNLVYFDHIFHLQKVLPYDLSLPTHPTLSSFPRNKQKSKTNTNPRKQNQIKSTNEIKTKHKVVTK